MRSVGPYWNDEHEMCRAAAATADSNGKRTGFFWLTQRAIGQMLRQGSGHVVKRCKPSWMRSPRRAQRCHGQLK